MKTRDNRRLKGGRRGAKRAEKVRETAGKFPFHRVEVFKYIFQKFLFWRK